MSNTTEMKESVETKATKEIHPETSPRRIILRNTIDLIIKTGDEVRTETPYRNILAIFNAVKDLPDDVQLTAWVREDEEQSEPISDEKMRYRKNFLSGENLTKKEFLNQLIGSLVDENTAMMNLQNLCDFLCVHSTMKCAIVSVVFEGKTRPVAGGFSFLSGSGEVKGEDLVVLGESAKSQVQMFKDKVLAIHPELTFPSDSKIILPGT